MATGWICSTKQNRGFQQNWGCPLFPHLPGQVRVVRFYHSCSPPPPPPPPHPPPPPPPSPPASPPPPLHPLPCSLPPCQLFAKLFANFRTQWALLDLNCKGLSALGTHETPTLIFEAVLDCRAVTTKWICRAVTTKWICRAVSTKSVTAPRAYTGVAWSQRSTREDRKTWVVWICCLFLSLSWTVEIRWIRHPFLAIDPCGMIAAKAKSGA